VEQWRTVWYNVLVAKPIPGDREEVIRMELFISFIATVMGGVVLHYIIKWLDSNDKGDK
jgi:hypothetical protein